MLKYLVGVTNDIFNKTISIYVDLVVFIFLHRNSVTGVDLTHVLEVEDSTDLGGEIACSGSSCEVI